MNQIIRCQQCQDSLLVFIDNEIEDSAIFNEIAFHLQECANCRTQLEIERQALNLIRQLLSRACCEIAPETLRDRVVEQVKALGEQEPVGFAQTEIITQYRRTEITIDGATQIEIETSHEIRRDYPL
jgi:mycothiol system anti-sigma-R factor